MYNLEIKFVTYSSQESLADRINFWPTGQRTGGWKYNGIMGLALRSVKSNYVAFLNKIRYFSIKKLANYPHEAGCGRSRTNIHLKLLMCLEKNPQPHGQ